jgi:PAS domain S-box-containing protein
MPDDRKTKTELLTELSALRSRIAQLERVASGEGDGGPTESEQTFRMVFENAPDGMLLADAESEQFCMGNKAVCQMLGFSPEEIAKLGIADIHTAEDLPYAIEQFGKHARGELSLVKNIPVKRKDGSVFYADISSSHTILAGRKYLMGIFRDVTERKRAEDELKQNEETFRLAMEATNDAVWDWNMVTNEVYRNPRHATMLGHEPDELTASQDEWDKRIHPDDKQFVIEATREHLRTVTMVHRCG